MEGQIHTHMDCNTPCRISGIGLIFSNSPRMIGSRALFECQYPENPHIDTLVSPYRDTMYMMKDISDAVDPLDQCIHCASRGPKGLCEGAGLILTATIIPGTYGTFIAQDIRITRVVHPVLDDNGQYNPTP